MKDWKPALAKNVTIETIKLPTIGSLKLEGVRGEFTPDGLFTRPMKRFNNKWLAIKFQDLIAYAKQFNTVIEGEFYIHGEIFADISSICRRSQHEDTDSIEFHVFDACPLNNPTEAFRNRTLRARIIVDAVANSHIKLVKQNEYTTAEECAELHSYALDHGYEGTVFRSPTSSYKPGRPTVKQEFMRIKAQDTYDGTVVDIIEMQENLVESKPNELGYMSKTQDKDMKLGKGMAAVAVTDADDFDGTVRVTLSRGLTDADRKEIWEKRGDYIGKRIRWVGIPVKGMLPRSPRFDAWRTDQD